MEDNEHKQHPCRIYIYDDTQAFLDFVCEHIASKIAEGGVTLFCSNNITLETLLNRYNSSGSMPRLVYQTHLLFQPLATVLNKAFQQNSSSNGIPDNQSVLIDFGSFCGSPFSVQQIVTLNN